MARLGRLPVAAAAAPRLRARVRGSQGPWGPGLAAAQMPWSAEVGEAPPESVSKNPDPPVSELACSPRAARTRRAVAGGAHAASGASPNWPVGLCGAERPSPQEQSAQAPRGQAARPPEGPPLPGAPPADLPCESLVGACRRSVGRLTAPTSAVSTRGSRSGNGGRSRGRSRPPSPAAARSAGTL